MLDKISGTKRPLSDLDSKWQISAGFWFPALVSSQHKYYRWGEWGSIDILDLLLNPDKSYQ